MSPSFEAGLPGLAPGKRAGERCVQLAEDNTCRLFGRPERPAFCGGLQPSAQMCGNTRADALAWLRVLEEATAPGA